MDWQKIKILTSKKDRRVNMAFNDKLWTSFKAACKANKTNPTNIFEARMLDYLEEKGLL